MCVCVHSCTVWSPHTLVHTSSNNPVLPLTDPVLKEATANASGGATPLPVVAGATATVPIVAPSDDKQETTAAAALNGTSQ